MSICCICIYTYTIYIYMFIVFSVCIYLFIFLFNYLCICIMCVYMCIYLYTSLSPYSRASLPARFLEARADPNQKDGRNNTSSLARVSSCVLEGPEK